MDRVVITIHPEPSDEGLLRVAEAMQQVIDALKIFAEADRAIGTPHQAFEWKLERASTNTPFTVVALAEAKNPTVDVSAHVRRVKAEVSSGVRNLIVRGEAPPWMSPEVITVVKELFTRNKNGIARTDIDFEAAAEPLTIDREGADAGLRAIEAINAIDTSDLPEREAFGEVEGVMIAAGRYRNRPAIQIRAELYGFVWCLLSDALIQRFGGEHKIADVWEGKVIGVLGRLRYGEGGKLWQIEAHDVREIDVPPIDLASVLDPDFTAGLDPHEYLRRLHEGDLA